MIYAILSYLTYSLISSMHYDMTVGQTQPSFIKSTIYGLFCPLTLLFKVAFLIPSLFGIHFHLIVTVQADSDVDSTNPDN